MLIELFMKVLDMTKAGGIVILLVILARLLLRKAPKVFSYALWAVVLFRLLCPVAFEATTSIMPEIKPVSATYTLADVPISPVNAGVAAYQAVGDAINGGLGIQHIRTELRDDWGGSEYVSSMWWEVWVLFGQYVWLAGLSVMAVYAVLSYIKILRKLITASPLRKNIFLADEITSPFVMGLIRPKIYLPSSMDEQEQSYILLHEQHHIRRLDHIFKALGFLALCIHWFNPLVWLAFILAGKDMEMSCDEAVVKKMGEDIRADYTASLLSLATGKRIIAGTPLAFGEGDTRGRIHNLANWKKPGVWIVLLALVLCVVLSVCLLTNPTSRNFQLAGPNVFDLDPQLIVSEIARIHKLDDPSLVKTNASNFELFLDSDFQWQDSPAMRFFYTKDQKTYSSQLRIFSEDKEYFVTEPTEWAEQNSIYLFQLYLEALKYLPQDSIKALAPDADAYIVTMVEEGNPGSYDRVLTYTSNGAGDIDGWFIHLQVAPLHTSADGGDFGQGEEVIHLFYNREMKPGITLIPNQATEWFDYYQNDQMKWDGRQEISIDAFPDVTFRWYSEKVEAIVGGKITPLYTGMPIWNVFFADLTGDGLPELCSTLSFGSGMIDERILIYDYANSVSYSLEDRGNFDFSLSLSNGRIMVTKRDHKSHEVVDQGYLAYQNETVTIVKAATNITELVPGTTYVPYQCIYLNPLSSYAAFGGDSGYTYTIGEDCFETVHRESGAQNLVEVKSWAWQEFSYTDEEWAALYIPAMNAIPKIRELFDEIQVLPLTAGKFLMRVDGSIWIVELASNPQMGTYLWSIYSLVPESAMGVAQWESAPMLSSRSPVFPFRFDMDYTEISAICTNGVLSEFNYGNESDTQLRISAGESLHWSPNNNGLPVSTDTIIRFTIHDGDQTVGAGTLYIESTGGSNNGRSIYTASLVGTGLHLSPNPDYEGGIITLVNGGTTASAVEHDLTAGKLETTVERLGQYIFFTNSTQIKVTVKGDSAFEGTIRLLDISQGNAEIAIREISKKDSKVTFTGLTSARLYRIEWDGPEDCIITISD